MRFHLDHTPPKAGFEIAHSNKIFLAGSCFSDNIGSLLDAYKFTTCANPSGILFNPLSIHACLSDCIEQKAFDENYLLQRGDLFLSYLHHSSIHDLDKETLIKKIDTANQSASAFLKESDYLIITFGTAFAYRHLQLNATVANCHKQPGPVFEKKLTGPEQIVELYEALITRLREFNPKLKIIFTVSPVKYLKDGLVENNLSKSILHLSIHRIIRQNNNCFYFPAYELVNDDLRDYRFYKKDLAHPNEQAIDYVWQKFSDCFFSDATLELNRQIHKLNLAVQHGQMQENQVETEKLKAFIEKQKQVIGKLHPGIRLE